VKEKIDGTKMKMRNETKGENEIYKVSK